MLALLASIFVASLIGSLHCAGMCGGIVVFCVGMTPDQPRGAWRLHATYNGGRLVGYMALGAISGGLGAAVDLGGELLGLQRIAAITAGGLMILFGAAALLRIGGVKLSCAHLPKPLQTLFERGYRGALNRPPILRSLMIGLLTALLPCGWLYAFVLASAGTGSAGMGAATMAAFWLGTLPVMLGIGVTLQTITGRLRRFIPAATAGVLILIGVGTVFGRVSIPSYGDAVRVQAQAKEILEDASCNTAVAIPDASNTPPCCQ